MAAQKPVLSRRLRLLLIWPLLAGLSAAVVVLILLWLQAEPEGGFPDAITGALGLLLAAVVFALALAKSEAQRVFEDVHALHEADHDHWLAERDNGRLTTAELRALVASTYLAAREQVEAAEEGPWDIWCRMRAQTLLDRVGDDRRAQLIRFIRGDRTARSERRVRPFRNAQWIISLSLVGAWLLVLAMVFLTLIGAAYAGWGLAWPPSPSWWAAVTLIGAAVAYTMLNAAALRALLETFRARMHSLVLYRIYEAEFAVPDRLFDEVFDAGISAVRRNMMNLTFGEYAEFRDEVEYVGDDLYWAESLQHIRWAEGRRPTAPWLHTLSGCYHLWSGLRHLRTPSGLEHVERAAVHLDLALADDPLVAGVALCHCREILRDDVAARQAQVVALEYLSTADRTPGSAASYAVEFVRERASWILPVDPTLADPLAAALSDPTTADDIGAFTSDAIHVEHFEALQQRARADVGNMEEA